LIKIIMHNLEVCINLRDCRVVYSRSRPLILRLVPSTCRTKGGYIWPSSMGSIINEMTYIAWKVEIIIHMWFCIAKISNVLLYLSYFYMWGIIVLPRGQKRWEGKVKNSQFWYLSSRDIDQLASRTM
jgi:hypothetical protein